MSVRRLALCVLHAGSSPIRPCPGRSGVDEGTALVKATLTAREGQGAHTVRSCITRLCGVVCCGCVGWRGSVSVTGFATSLACWLLCLGSDLKN